jgi:hypothetical protein
LLQTKLRHIESIAAPISVERDTGKLVLSFGSERGFRHHLQKELAENPRAVRYFTATQHNIFCAVT